MGEQDELCLADSEDRQKDWNAAFDTNVFGPVRATKALLPHMRARRSGTLVFIGSLSGWYGDPFMSTYSGTKFALEGKRDRLLDTAATLNEQHQLTA